MAKNKSPKKRQTKRTSKTPKRAVRTKKRIKRATKSDFVPSISMLLYGKAGCGKSVLANTFPKALIFDFDNSHKLYKAHFSDNTYINKPITVEKKGRKREFSMIELLQNAIEKIKSKKFEYETLVIDSLTNLENEAVSFARGLDERNWHKNLYSQDGRKLSYDNWGNISGSTISMLMELRKYNVNIIVITQVETKQVDDTEKQYPQLIGKGQDEALHFPDFVGYMTKVKGKSGIERYLHLNSFSSDNFVAKARLVQGEVEPIKNPHYDDIVELITVEKSGFNFEK